MQQDLALSAYFRACRYLLQNMDWLDDELGEFENDYLIIDCPGEGFSQSIYLAQGPANTQLR